MEVPLRKFTIFIKFLVAFSIGFIVAAHWNDGRKFVQGISPAYNQSFSKGIQGVTKGLKETGKNIKNKITD